MWLKKWRIKVNRTKSVHMTFIIRYKETYSSNDLKISQTEDVKYLELYLGKTYTHQIITWTSIK